MKNWPSFAGVTFANWVLFAVVLLGGMAYYQATSGYADFISIASFEPWRLLFLIALLAGYLRLAKTSAVRGDAKFATPVQAQSPSTGNSGTSSNGR